MHKAFSTNTLFWGLLNAVILLVNEFLPGSGLLGGFLDVEILKGLRLKMSKGLHLFLTETMK